MIYIWTYIYIYTCIQEYLDTTVHTHVCAQGLPQSGGSKWRQPEVHDQVEVDNLANRDFCTDDSIVYRMYEGCGFSSQVGGTQNQRG